MPAKVSINLLSDQDIDHTPIGRIVSWAVTYGRYIMIGTEIVVLLAFISRFSLDRKLNDLKEEIDQKQAIIEVNQPLEQSIKTVQQRLEKAKTIVATAKNPAETITLLQGLLPTDVYVDTLQINNTQITASVIAGTTTGFSQFIANLQNEKTFSQVDFGDIRRDPLRGITFQINITRNTKLVPKP